MDGNYCRNAKILLISTNMETGDKLKTRRDTLAALLRDPDDDVRAAAARALERLESFGSLGEVLDSLKKGDMGAKIKALYALGRIGGEQVLPALIYCATRPEEDIRSVAVEVLGGLAHPKGLPAIVDCLKDPSPAIRAKAVAALGNFRDPTLASQLAPFLDENDGLLDAEAVRALARIGDSSLVGKFIELSHSPFPRTREAAAFALGEVSAD